MCGKRLYNCTETTCTAHRHTQKGANTMQNKWYKEAVFYQIYPRSFKDGNGDGIGDIAGIISKVDYLASLGIDAIWFSPLYASPNADFGYDISDYKAINPEYGTMEQFDEMVRLLHDRNIRVVMDLVINHTSDKHKWFVEARKSKDNPYRDYYYWADGKGKNGKKPPNNWTSFFLGSAWQYDQTTDQYYLHLFDKNQPDLNYHNPKVMEEIKSILRFWLDKGVDGFRVDMAASLVKGDKDKKAIKALWAEMRTWMDAKYPNHILVSEWCDPQVSIPAGFNIDFMIHIGQKCYSTLFFPKGTPWQGNNPNPDKECYFDRNGKGNLEKFIDVYAENYEKTKNDGYIAIPTANHDFQRPNVGSRNTPEQLKVTMTFSLTMPGVPFIYYGDEIGMKYQMNLPSKEGSRERAGTRTPMQWTNGANAGFSTVSDASKLYFPVDTENGKLTVETQEADKASMLNYVRTLLKLRAENPALGNDADWKLLNVKGGQVYPMVYVRSAAGQKVMVALNPTAKKQTMAVEGEAKKVLSTTGKANFKKGKVTLGAFSTLIVELQ